MLIGPINITNNPSRDFLIDVRVASRNTLDVIPRESGVSSTPRLIG
jgi:hypothetical protein